MIMVSDGHKKSMDSILFILDDQLREHNGMVRIHAEIANPPLRSLNTRCIHYKSLILIVISRSCHQRLNIGTMPKFSLRVTAQYLPTESWFQEELNLLFSAEVR